MFTTKSSQIELLSFMLRTVTVLVMCGWKKEIWDKEEIGHWVGYMDGESGVVRTVCTKRQLFGETIKNTNYLSATLMRLTIWNRTQSRILKMRPIFVSYSRHSTFVTGLLEDIFGIIIIYHKVGTDNSLKLLANRTNVQCWFTWEGVLELSHFRVFFLTFCLLRPSVVYVW